MKKFYYLALAAIVSVVMTSCGGTTSTNNEPKFSLSNLQALWQENNTEHFVRFTTEQSDEAGYLYGREWDEAEDVTEEDLKPYGNGWFKYKFETKGDLHEIHLMDNDGAVIPKEYIVSILTNTELSYYEKDRTSSKYNFTKVVTPSDDEKKNPSFNPSDLQGLWEMTNTQHYVRFTTEESDLTGFLYGREWDEAEEVTEEDLTPYGAGWFKYEFKSDGNLTVHYLLDNGGSLVPKEFVVTKLTKEELSYYEKDHPNNIYNLTKVVSAK